MGLILGFGVRWFNCAAALGWCVSGLLGYLRVWLIVFGVWFVVLCA